MFNYQFKFSKQVLERHDIRVVGTMTLFPVYDDNEQLVEIVLLKSNDKDEIELKDELVYGTRWSLNNKPDSSSKTLFITDSIKNMLALNEKLKKPAIVVNSLSCLSTKVIFRDCIILFLYF